jgi:hypothetical protein
MKKDAAERYRDTTSLAPSVAPSRTLSLVRGEVVARPTGHDGQVRLRLGLLVERDWQLRLDAPERPECGTERLGDQTNSRRVWAAPAARGRRADRRGAPGGPRGRRRPGRSGARTPDASSASSGSPCLQTSPAVSTPSTSTRRYAQQLDGLQPPLRAHVRVDLSGGQRLVPEQFLRRTIVYTLARVRFEWDPPKAEANLRTHGLSRFVTLGLSRRGTCLWWCTCTGEPTSYA